MGRPYGKTALSATLKMPNFDKYFKKIEVAGNDIDGACRDAVNAALPIVKASMIAGAKRHKDSGDVVNAIEESKAISTGNYTFGAVGIDMQKHPEAIHGVYQEYGDGHSPGFPDPFVRPAIDDNRKAIIAAERAVLREKGVSNK